MSKKLYVGNLPYQASEDQVQDFFTQAGISVESVNLMRDRFSGQPRGFGFVEVSDDDLNRAIQACHGKQMGGRALVVNEARPMNAAGGGGGGPRGGHGGGGGDRDRRGGGGGGRQRY